MSGTPKYEDPTVAYNTGYNDGAREALEKAAAGKTEAEALGELDRIFAGLDEPARCRALNWLRAKHIPNANLPEATGDRNERSERLRAWLGGIGGERIC